MSQSPFGNLDGSNAQFPSLVCQPFVDFHPRESQFLHDRQRVLHLRASSFSGKTGQDVRSCVCKSLKRNVGTTRIPDIVSGLLVAVSLYGQTTADGMTAVEAARV